MGRKDPNGRLTCSCAVKEALLQFHISKQVKLFMQRVMQVTSQATNETGQEETAYGCIKGGLG